MEGACGKDIYNSEKHLVQGWELGAQAQSVGLNIQGTMLMGSEPLLGGSLHVIQQYLNVRIGPHDHDETLVDFPTVHDTISWYIVILWYSIVGYGML